MRTAVITSRNYIPVPPPSEQTLQRVNPKIEQYRKEIAYLEQYKDDLLNGKPVDNLSPSEDKWFLIPENIEIMIDGIKSAMQGKGKVINPDALWEGLA